LLGFVLDSLEQLHYYRLYEQPVSARCARGRSWRGGSRRSSSAPWPTRRCWTTCTPRWSNWPRSRRGC